MKTNIGTRDRGVRLAIAVLCAMLAYQQTLPAMQNFVLAALAIISLFTGVAGYCPLYKSFSITTAKK